ncbi:MAG: hypothetical protein IKO99_11400 [Bacteroidales bacterium]|nr:hypothetical protein [Bacteroidales bacterium]
MPLYFTIQNFRVRLTALLTVRKKVYAGVLDEIAREFSSADIAKLRVNNDMILLEDSFIVIKLRLPDKKQKLSKSNGYRIIYLTYKDVDKVVFLDIYPKRGPLQQISISDKDLLNLLKEYLSESKNGLLEEYVF